MIKNVVLDMGNVLLDCDIEKPLERFCTTPAEKDIIRAQLFFGPEWIEGDRGSISDRQRLELVRRRVPARHHRALERCALEWHSCVEPVEGAHEFCDCVRSRGLGLYVLSNADNRFHDYFARFAPAGFFDGIVVSSDVHMIKPEAGIYEYLLNKYALKAGECLFIDDREENVLGAIAVGLEGVLFENNYGLIREKYGL